MFAGFTDFNGKPVFTGFTGFTGSTGFTGFTGFAGFAKPHFLSCEKRSPTIQELYILIPNGFKSKNSEGTNLTWYLVCELCGV